MAHLTNSAARFSRLGCADDAIANFPPTLDGGPRRSLRRGPPAYAVDLSTSEQSGKEEAKSGNEEDGLVQAFGQEGAARLRALRRKHDPSGVFS